jgi:hypothetical protein
MDAGILKFFDAYTVRARVLPGLLAALPLAVTVYAWKPGDLLSWNSLGGVIAAFGGTILLAFIARDLGKAAEDRLYKKWGGRPTELLMLHSGPVDPALLVRRHSALRRLFPKISVPTSAEETQDRAGAIQRFTTFTTLVITRHRTMKDRFPLVFEENCNYGFRRNMYGLRWIGLSVAAVTSIALGLDLYIKFSTHEPVDVVSLALEGLNVLMLLVWILWARESAVRRGADLYAARLFETLDAPRSSG